MLSVTAGMFHAWDKEVRGWLLSEIRHWTTLRELETVNPSVWIANFSDIFELLDAMKGTIRSEVYFRQLDACRLVVNVYKHGNGKSFDELKEQYPEYLEPRIKSDSGKDFRNHTHLTVSHDQFQAFSEAIISFWKSVPNETWASDVARWPRWLEKAFAKCQR